MEMILRRLTKIEKNEILEDFRSGLSANDLAEKYNCSSNTITRTVKKLLTNEEYNLLKEKKSKSKNPKMKVSESELSNNDREVKEEEKAFLKYPLDKKNDNLEISNSSNHENKNYIKLDSKKINSNSLEKNDNYDVEFNSATKDCENNFEEIVPLISSYVFETQQQKVNCKNLDKVTLPESVYMLVDKKVELEPQLISELPDWSFLPDNELKRHAILLFPNQRTAKRNCPRNQKVIKIPNTNIFKNLKSYLLAKGITRLIIEDSLISLEY